MGRCEMKNCHPSKHLDLGISFWDWGCVGCIYKDKWGFCTFLIGNGERILLGAIYVQTIKREKSLWGFDYQGDNHCPVGGKKREKKEKKQMRKWESKTKRKKERRTFKE